MKVKKILVGRQEWCALPNLDLSHICAKIDTGAKTSALHAENIQLIESDAGRIVRFLVRPFSNESDHISQCEMPVKSTRFVKSSNGKKELRCVVETVLCIGPVKKKIELTLTNRSLMRFNLLLGREALKKFAIVDPSKRYLLDQVEDSSL